MKRSGHQYVEAYCWMYYETDDGSDGVWIYNSRDGVTPFIHLENGKEYTHTEWSKDLYRPNYKPKEGDRIWVTMSKEEWTDLKMDYVNKIDMEQGFPVETISGPMSKEELLKGLIQGYQEGTPTMKKILFEKQ